jgi:hypothetical protein
MQQLQMMISMMLMQLSGEAGPVDMLMMEISMRYAANGQAPSDDMLPEIV